MPRIKTSTKVRRYLNSQYPQMAGAEVEEFVHLEGHSCWRRYLGVPRRRACLSYQAILSDFEAFLDATYDRGG